MKPIIAVAGHTDINEFGSKVTTVPLAYTRSVEAAGGIPLIVPFTLDKATLALMTAGAQGILFPGGPDVDPEYFQQAPEPGLGRVDKELDQFQFAVFELALDRKLPVLGICRGAQLINVALGRDLYQDIPTRFPESKLPHMQKTLSFDTDHHVNFTPGSRLHRLFGDGMAINSRHHQSIKTPGRDVEITATAPDGVVEAAEHTQLPIDLIQWHPELMMQKDHTMLPLFRSFIDNCRQPERQADR